MAGVVAAAAVALVAFFYYSTQPTEAVEQTERSAPLTAATITVHVSGAVQAPGLVEVASSARVADVIAAAGGTTSEASLVALNLAAPVRDGEQVVVPTWEDRSEAVTAGEGRVRLNTASASELEQIPGVGPVLAGRIIEARESIGGFAAVEDLLDVSGIGEAKLAALREHVTVP
ncbi:MAG: ComEA family DNA-binding protein [bacterium]|nr:ComEA family DNA-binding protein [bacterium]